MVTTEVDGFEQWALDDVSALQTIWPGAEFRALGHARFVGTVLRRTLRTVTIEGIDATPYAVRRDSRHVAHKPRTNLMLNAIMRGRGTVKRGSSTFSPGAGDVFLLRTDQPFEYRCPVNTRTFRATVSDSLLPAVLRTSYEPPFEVLRSSSVVRAFVTLADDLLSCEPGLAPSRASAPHLDAALVSLEQGVLAEELASRPSVDSERGNGLLAAVLEYIEAHLHDRALGPRTLASEFGISLRTLHGLFDPMPETAAARIRRRRIEDAAAILRDREATTPELANSLGFSSADSFQRSFRRSQGVPPAQYRALRRHIVE